MNTFISCLLVIFCCQISFGQKNNEEEKPEPPAFKIVRAEESYLFLKEKENNPYKNELLDGIKFIPLTKNKEAYLSLGGQIRTRFEHYSNRLWINEVDQDFYSQRISIHSNIVFNKNLRVFGELFHGYTSHEREFTEFDQLNIHQAFIDFKFPLKKSSISFRFGRQEMGLGASRLVGIREGPNIRRSFDQGRFIYKSGKTIIQAFYGKEVSPVFGTFNNEFSLFDNQAPNPELWGGYSQFKIKGLIGLNEVYYLGFQSDNARFGDVTGREIRHSIGIRRFGTSGERWQYNTEVIYQFGTIGNSNISAFDIESDWHYKLINTPWQPRPGIKLQYTSGDNNLNDGTVNTF